MLLKIQQIFVGYISKQMMVMLVVASAIIYFGSVIIAAHYFPGPYHWSDQVISKLTSPRDNPDNYWMPCAGLMVSALLVLPFAGYLERRLRGFAPRLGRLTGVVFALALVLLLLTGLVVPQKVIPGFGHRTHEFLARGSAGAFALGMICCCIYAFRDRRDGRRTLSNVLSHYWRWATLLPVGGAVSLALLLFLGHVANQAWAEQARMSFRHTPMWNLAFWEWIGSVIFFAFMLVSVLLLPEGIKTSGADVTEVSESHKQVPSCD